MERLQMLNMSQDLNDDFLKHQLSLQVKEHNSCIDISVGIQYSVSVWSSGDSGKLIL